MPPTRKAMYKKQVKKIVRKNKNIHTFKQTINAQNIYNDPIASNGFGFNFQLAQLDQVATFGDLFDQYRIDSVTIKLLPRAQTTHDPGTTTGSTPSYFYSTIDYDDGNVPTTLSELREYEKCKVLTSTQGKVYNIKIVPRVALAAFSGAFTSYANKSKMWIDCASTTVQHYGWKCIFPPAGVGNAVGSVNYDVMITFKVSFQNVR